MTNDNKGDVSVVKDQSVVPIGGAPFVQPLVTMLQGDESPKRSRQGPILIDPQMSPTSSISSGMSISSDRHQTLPSGSPTSPHWEDALRYSLAMREHTQRMWEQERMTIERSRLGSAESSSEDKKTSSTPNRSSFTGSVDALFRGRKKHSKNSSVI